MEKIVEYKRISKTSIKFNSLIYQLQELYIKYLKRNKKKLKSL